MPPNGSAPMTTRSSASTRSRSTTTIRAGGKVAVQATTSSTSPSGTAAEGLPVDRRSLPLARSPGAGWSRNTITSIRPRSTMLMPQGAVLRAFPQPVMEACFKAANEVYAELSQDQSDFKKLYESLIAYRSDGNLWFQVAECRLRQLHDAHAHAHLSRSRTGAAKKSPGASAPGFSFCRPPSIFRAARRNRAAAADRAARSRS